MCSLRTTRLSAQRVLLSRIALLENLLARLLPYKVRYYPQRTFAKQVRHKVRTLVPQVRLEPDFAPVMRFDVEMQRVVYARTAIVRVCCVFEALERL